MEIISIYTYIDIFLRFMKGFYCLLLKTFLYFLNFLQYVYIYLTMRGKKTKLPIHLPNHPFR